MKKLEVINRYGEDAWRRNLNNTKNWLAEHTELTKWHQRIYEQKG